LPFASMFIEPDDDVEQIRYQIDGGSWNTISLGEYPSLLIAARSEEFIPTEIQDRYTFTVEITAGDILLEQEVDILCGVVAGRDKQVYEGSSIHPFYDALFAKGDDYLSSVQYSIDDGAKEDFSSDFGEDLADRARAFSLIMGTAGTYRFHLWVTDSSSGAEEHSGSLIVKVK